MTSSPSEPEDEDVSGTAGSDYRVQLEAFAGPLDLLLHLVKRHEIDLHDIPIARLTDQYMQHLEGLHRVDVERAGEFLVMASTLLQIKSAMLMPQPEQEETEEGQEEDATAATDPRYELVQQLLAYKRYKDAALDLEQKRETWSRRAPVAAATPSQKKKQPDEEQSAEEAPQEDGEAEAAGLELGDLSITDLCHAFTRLIETVGTKPPGHEIVYDETPIAVHAQNLYDRLAAEGPLTLYQAIAALENRAEMIGVFLALLELVRDDRVRAQHDEGENQIWLSAVPEEAQRAADQDVETDWRDPETGRMQYAFPTEEDRTRYEQGLHRKRQSGGPPWQRKTAAEADGADGGDAEDEDEGESDETGISPEDEAERPTAKEGDEAPPAEQPEDEPGAPQDNPPEKEEGPGGWA
jgi:segregation and condensation protein A